MEVKTSLKNVCNISFLAASILYGFYSMKKNPDTEVYIKNELSHDYNIFCICCYGLMLFFFCLIAPQIMMTLIGIIFFGPFDESNIKPIPAFAQLPFICIRVVTRGSFPKLVRKNVVNNIETTKACGIKDFVVEVVTDHPIYIEKDLQNYAEYLKETVVPENYKSNLDTKKKARALQYCLEKQVNTLKKDDYVVHLDEETLLTTEAIKGITNFIIDGKHEIGQGIITYGMLPPISSSISSFTWFQHHICTVADSLRVSDDVGKNKAQFKIFHKPLFGMKGSYVVTKFKAENEITWDFGPEGSVAEDAWFGLAAIERGYTIDYIKGDMLERSPFTLLDFIKQRQRWMQGLFMVAFLSPMKIKTKICLVMSVSSWLVSPLYTITIILQKFLWLNPPGLIILIQRFMEIYFVALHVVGYMRQFKCCFGKYLFFIPNIVLGCISNAVLENIATLLAIKSLLVGDCYGFHVVQKEILGDNNTSFVSTRTGDGQLRNGFNNNNDTTSKHDKTI